jgi:hypothetical protein
VRGLSDEYAEWAGTLHLQEVEQILESFGCDAAFVKGLAPNDNSKNQIYVGADLTQLSELPSGEIEEVVGTSRKPGNPGRLIYRAPVALRWATSQGVLPAPEAKVIYYPQYPEVRLSGFLRGAIGGPNSLLDPDRRGREPGRALILGRRGPTGELIGVLLPAEAPANQELSRIELTPYAAFLRWVPEKGSWVRPLNSTPAGRVLTVASRIQPPDRVPIVSSGAPVQARAQLLRELCRVHRSEWIPSCKLTQGGPVPYSGQNGGGLTLEAQLGILPNGSAEPDFLGWEVKQHTVGSFAQPRSATITLMTPEPDGGVYFEDGVKTFVERWGYFRDGVTNRKDFGGVHRVGEVQQRTRLQLLLEGYDPAVGKPAPKGRLVLRDSTGVEAAVWTFAKLLTHWKNKHSSAVYVPSEKRAGPDGDEYRFGMTVTLGEGTSFPLLLDALAAGVVKYDPGIHIDLRPDGSWSSKKRNQLRISSRQLGLLYTSATSVETCGSSEPAVRTPS